MNKYIIVLCPYNGRLFQNKKKWNPGHLYGQQDPKYLFELLLPNVYQGMYY